MTSPGLLDTTPAAPEPVPGRGVVLNWSKHRVGQRPGKCRICKRPALMRDEKDKPCHKTCVERQLTERAARAARAYAKSRGEP